MCLEFLLKHSNQFCLGFLAAAEQLIQDSSPQPAYPALDNVVSGQVAARNPESGCCQKS